MVLQWANWWFAYKKILINENTCMVGIIDRPPFIRICHDSHTFVVWVSSPFFFFIYLQMKSLHEISGINGVTLNGLFWPSIIFFWQLIWEPFINPHKFHIHRELEKKKKISILRRIIVLLQGHPYNFKKKLCYQTISLTLPILGRFL